MTITPNCRVDQHTRCVDGAAQHCACTCHHNARVLEQLTREALAGPHGWHECPDHRRCVRHPFNNNEEA